MPDENKHGTECTEFEALLSDALEGQLSPARKESFEAHRRVCAVCGPLFADVQAGQRWLRELEAVEPPAYLVHNILVATSGVVSTRAVAATAGGRTTPFGERLRERWDSFFTPLAAFVRQPRFVMSFGMIFFSFSLALNAVGEAFRPGENLAAAVRAAACLQRRADQSREVLRQYPLRVRNRIEGARAEAGQHSRRARARGTETKSQERYQRATRPETGSQLFPGRQP